MDRTEADAITKMLEWALTQMKHLESEAAALEQTLQNYPVVVKEGLDANQPFRVEEQIRFLQVAVELARNTEAIQGPIHQKYDTFLARIRERPVSLDEMELALKAFEAWKLSGPVN
jgi:flagellar biosynthesis chaperone FliJ